MSLLESTQTLLECRLSDGLSLRGIAETSDGAVNYEWLKKFSAGKIEDPGVNRIQLLHEHLIDLAIGVNRAAN